MSKERGKPTITPIEAQIRANLGAEASAASIHPTRTTRFAPYSTRVFKKICASPLTLRKNKSGMHRKILGYVILFLICISIALVMTPSVVEAANFSTNAYIWVEPSIIGVGQKVEISMSVYPFPPTGNVFHNYRVIITKPDGVNETLGPFSSDTTGFAATQYVAQQVGTFHAQFFFQREVFNGGDSYNASVSSSTTFIVQQNPVSMHLTIAISGSGSTNPVPGVYSYNPGDNVSVTALPAPGWIFSYWGDESNSNPYNLTMFADKYLEAYFTQIQYSLNNTVTGSGTINPSPGIHQYASGTVVNVSATPNSGWILSSLMLNGVNVGSASPYYLLMDANKTLTAVFTPIPSSLNITVTGSGTTNPALGIHQYTPGTVVSVNAIPGSGWSFGYWMLNGVNVSSFSPYSVTMDANKTLTAVFTQNLYSLNITVTGSGTTNPTPGVHQYLSGTIVSASATPTSGWTLSSWTLNGVNVGSGNPYSVTMDANKTLTAVFVPIQYRLTTSVSGSGTISPAPGSYQYQSGAVVNVTATPNSGWMLSSLVLNGVNVSSVSPYYLSMDSNDSLTAVFTQIPYTLNISVTGSGTTNPTPAVRQYLSGTVVGVSAIPSSGWTLSSWMLNGVNEGINSPYTVTMDADKTLTAVFTQQPAYTLSTVVSGSGNISPDPGGHQYAAGTAVSVSAAPASGWTFSYWLLNGVNVGSTSTYTVSMNADNTLTAVFKQQPPLTAQLTISVQGSGSTSPAVGNHTYDLGTSLQVTAQPNANWSFNCWLLNNNNISQALNYLVTMNGDQSLVAIFQQNNLRPSAVIDSIGPSSATVGQQVTLSGHGNDTDGVITGYRWISDIDGLLSTLPSFSISNLSVGTHRISFQVQDNNGDWSIKSEQAITIEESTSLSLVAISVAAVAGSIILTGGLILFRGKLSNFFRSKVRFKKNTDTENQKEKEEKKKKQKEKNSLELNATLPPRIMESRLYDAQINVKNTGNSNVKDIVIRAQATPGISISRNERTIRSLKAGKNSNQVFQFQGEKHIDRGHYVLRFDMKSQVTSEQTKSSFTRAVKIGVLSDQKNSQQEVYKRWLSKHSYAWDELNDADDLCNCLLNYNLLILSPEVELKKQWENNIVKFVKSGQSLLILSSNMLARPESLANALGYADMNYEVVNSSQLPIRVLNQHPIVSEFSPGEQLNLKNCTGDVCVSKNSTGIVVAEYPSVNGKPNIPAIIAKEDKGKVVYFNFHAPPQFDTLLKNTIEWLLETTENPQQ